MSGRRDSNSQLPPWKGGALPIELLPHRAAKTAPYILLESMN